MSIAVRWSLSEYFIHGENRFIQQKLHDAILFAAKSHQVFLVEYLISRDYCVELFDYKILFCMPSIVSFYLYKRFLIKSALLNISVEFSDLITKITDPFISSTVDKKKMSNLLYPKVKSNLDNIELCKKFLNDKTHDPETGKKLIENEGLYIYWMSTCERYHL